MDKKIDKDNLMNQLYDYLTEEIREHYKVKDYLSKELSQYQKEKDLMVKDVSDENRIYKIRKGFFSAEFSGRTTGSRSYD